MAKTILDSRHLPYVVIDAEENADLSRKYDIHQAPTLVVIRGDEVSTISSITNIKQYAMR